MPIQKDKGSLFTGELSKSKEKLEHRMDKQ